MQTPGIHIDTRHYYAFKDPKICESRWKFTFTRRIGLLRKAQFPLRIHTHSLICNEWGLSMTPKNYFNSLPDVNALQEKMVLDELIPTIN